MARIQNLAHFIPSKSFLNISSLLLRPSKRNPRTCSKWIGGWEGEKRKKNDLFKRLKAYAKKDKLREVKLPS